MHPIYLKGKTFLRRDDSSQVRLKCLWKVALASSLPFVLFTIFIQAGRMEGWMSSWVSEADKKEKQRRMVFCFKYSSSWHAGSAFHLMFARIFHKRNLINPQTNLWRKRISVLNVLLWWLQHIAQVSPEGRVIRERLGVRDRAGVGYQCIRLILHCSARPPQGPLNRHGSFPGSCLSSLLSAGSQLGLSKGSNIGQHNQACFAEVKRNFLWGFALCVLKDQLYDLNPKWSLTSFLYEWAGEHLSYQWQVRAVNANNICGFWTSDKS